MLAFGRELCVSRLAAVGSVVFAGGSGAGIVAQTTIAV